MSKMMDPILGEFQQEAATTKRVLDRVPPDKLAWKPHPKSMSLGQLAMHVATIPGQMSMMAQADESAGFQSARPERSSRNYGRARLRRQDRARVPWRRQRLGCRGELETYGERQANRGHASRCDDPSLHAEPLVSSSRAIVSVFTIAGCSSSDDLRAQCGRKPVWLNLWEHFRGSCVE